jgi:hypothetical protein
MRTGIKNKAGMQHSNHPVNSVQMQQADSDNSIEHLKEYSPSLSFTGRHTTPVDRAAFTVRHTTPVVRAIQQVGESDIVAPATGDLCDGCKATEPHAPDSAACHGCSPVRATASSLASISDSELPYVLYKNNGKPTIDRNFFKSMAKTIKASRASIADAEVVDEEACTHYTGYYTSNSCGEKTRYVNWVEGDALRMRIEVKLRLIHERMLAPEASNNRRLGR